MQQTANVKTMSVSDVVAEIESYVVFADSDDMETIQGAIDEVKDITAHMREEDYGAVLMCAIVSARIKVLSKLMLAYHELALAAKAEKIAC